MSKDAPHWISRRNFLKAASLSATAIAAKYLLPGINGRNEGNIIVDAATGSSDVLFPRYGRDRGLVPQVEVFRQYGNPFIFERINWSSPLARRGDEVWRVRRLTEPPLGFNSKVTGRVSLVNDNAEEALQRLVMGGVEFHCIPGVGLKFRNRSEDDSDLNPARFLDSLMDGRALVNLDVNQWGLVEVATVLPAFQIRSGDTIGSLSEALKVTPEELTAWNQGTEFRNGNILYKEPFKRQN